MISNARFDWLLWVSSGIIITASLTYWVAAELLSEDGVTFQFTQAGFTLMNTVWWGRIIGIVMIGLLNKVPRVFVIASLGGEDDEVSSGQVSQVYSLMYVAMAC